MSYVNVQFIKDINNLIFQIFTFKVLWDSLYSYIVLPSILISAIYFNFIIFIRASPNKQTWLSSLPTRFCNDEASTLNDLIFVIKQIFSEHLFL